MQYLRIGHVHSIPTMQFFHRNFQKYSVEIICMLSLTEFSGIYKIMHFGIRINMPYSLADSVLGSINDFGRPVFPRIRIKNYICGSVDNMTHGVT